MKSGLVEVEYTAEQPEPEEVIKRWVVVARVLWLLGCCGC